MLKHLKKQAKEKLKTKYSQCFVAIMLIFFINVIFMFSKQISFLILNYNIFDTSYKILGQTFQINFYAIIIWTIIIIIQFLIITPFKLGIKSWYYNSLESGYNYILKSILKLNYFKTIFLKINLFFRYTFFNIIFFLPAIITFFFSYFNLTGSRIIDFSTVILLLLSFILFSFGIIISIYFNSRYFLVEYIYIENKNKKIKEIIRLSCKKMKNNKQYVLSLYISFIPLLLTCIFIIPIFFVIPYINKTFAEFAKSIIENKDNIIYKK